MAEVATAVTGAYEGYELTTSLWERLTKRRYKVSFGAFIRSFEKKNTLKLSKDEKYRIEWDLRRKGLLVTDNHSHRSVLPKPTYTY